MDIVTSLGAAHCIFNNAAVNAFVLRSVNYPLAGASDYSFGMR